MSKPKQQAKAKSSASLFFENNRVVYTLIFGLAFILFANTFGHEYALDDRAVTFQNKFVQAGFKGIPDILKTFYWRGFWEANAGLYRPVSVVVFAIEWQFFGNSSAMPHIFHFVNVVLFATTCVLLYRMLRRLLSEQPAQLSFMAVLLFIVHPIHTEVVANIKSLDEILSLLFFVLVMEQLLKQVAQPNVKHVVLSTLYFFLALMSKEGAVLFFPVMGLALWYFAKLDFKRIGMLLAPLAVIGLVWFGIHSAVISNAGPRAPYSYQDNALLASPDFITQRATAIGMMGRYLLKLVVPYPMSYDYSFSEIPNTGLGDVTVLTSLVALLGLLFLAVKQMKQKTILSFSIWWFFITIALTCNIFTIIGATMADRFLFVPSLGFCLALSWLLLRFTKSLGMQANGVSAQPMVITIVILLPFSLMSFTRNKDWKSDETLYAADVASADGSGRVHYNYGTVLMNAAANETNPQQKNILLKSAEEEFVRTTKIDTGFGSWNAYENLGAVLFRQQRYAESAEASRQAFRRNPNDPSVLDNLADAFVMQQQYDTLVAFMKRCVAAKVSTAKTLVYIGVGYLNKKDTVQALATLNEAVKAHPDYSQAWDKLGAVQGMSHQYTESIASLEKAYALDATDIGALEMIAVSYKAMGNMPKSQEYHDRYLKARGTVPEQK